MSKLSKSKQEVWDRLKNGICPQDVEYETTEMVITRYMAEQMAAEIDKEMLKEIIAECQEFE